MRSLAVMIAGAGLLLASCSSPAPATPVATATPEAIRVPSDALEEVTAAPARDALAVAMRYGVQTQPLPDGTLFRNEAEGTRATFWAVDPPGPTMFALDATLRSRSPSALWYVEDGAGIEARDIAEAVRRFDEEIAPGVLDLMAPNLRFPGPITVVLGDIPGVAGYFSAGDTIPAAAYRFSNERAAIFLHLPPDLTSPSFLGTLAHEFHHLIQWRVDPGEETWINEGLAELAARESGLQALPLSRYLEQPSVSITDWPDQPGASIPNYAGASLFMSHLADVTGRDQLHRFVAGQADGIDGVREFLLEIGAGVSFEDLYAGWAVANLQGTTAGLNGAKATVQAAIEPNGSIVAEVPQMGVYYASINIDEPVEVRFDGNETAGLIPVDPYSGEFCWWGNGGDGIDSTLTRQLDLTGVDRATLRFSTWHDIEEDWDRAYVAVSTDGGVSWTPVQGRHTSGEDPVGTSLGHSITGASDAWLQEEMDLTSFAGSEVLLRFEYVTDESVHGAGWCIDDIEIPELGMSDGAETSSHAWDVQGFVRAPSAGIRQLFIVRIVEGDGPEALVRDIALDAQNAGTIRVAAPSTLVVIPLSAEASVPATFVAGATR